ncbi:hypothetical protein HDU97_004893 [Phlyctochytrium planicorne]|nr:hypothetical protein HDU97_004893 [Phlyctochytrium planicorne]
MSICFILTCFTIIIFTTNGAGFLPSSSLDPSPVPSTSSEDIDNLPLPPSNNDSAPTSSSEPNQQFQQTLPKLPPASSYPLAYLSKAREKYLIWPANFDNSTWGKGENICLPALLGDDIYKISEPVVRCGKGAKRTRAPAPSGLKSWYNDNHVPGRLPHRPRPRDGVDEGEGNFEVTIAAEENHVSKEEERMRWRALVKGYLDTVKSKRPPPRSNLIKPPKGSLSDATLAERFCESTNIAINVRFLPGILFGDETDAEIKAKDKKAGLDWWGDNGVLKGRCEMDEEWWVEEDAWGNAVGASGWLMRALEVEDPEVVKEEIECDAWIETPLFFTSRWDTTNPYQAHQDFLNTFRVYSTLGINADEILPVFLDTRQVDGPYTQIWADVFGGGSRILDIRQLASIVVQKYQQSPHQDRTKPRNLCLRKATWGLHGGISPIAKGGMKYDGCANAPLIHAFAAFMRDRVGLALSRVEGNGKVPEDLMHIGPWLDAGKEDPEGVVEGVHYEFEEKKVKEEPKVTTVFGDEEGDDKEPSTSTTASEATATSTPTSETRTAISNPSTAEPSTSQNQPPLPRSNPETTETSSEKPRAPRSKILRVTYAIRQATTNPTPITCPWTEALLQGLQDHTVLPTNSTYPAPPLLPLPSTLLPPPMPPKALTRKVSDQSTILRTLSKTVSTWKPPQNSTLSHATFTAIDFATLPLSAQIHLAQSTDIFIAPHGAVFIHTLYLRNTPHSAILEIQPPERAVGNHQFRNMATRLGRTYKKVSVQHGEMAKGVVANLVAETKRCLDEVAKSLMGLEEWREGGEVGDYVVTVPRNSPFSGH